MLSLVFFIGSLFFFSSLQANPVTLTGDRPIALTSQLQEFRGADGNAFESISQSTQFESGPSQDYITADPAKKRWYRLTLKNIYENGYWYLSFSNTRMDRIELYLPGPNGSSIQKVTGDSLPVSRWSDPDLYYTFRIYMQTGEEKTLYFSIEDKDYSITEVNISGPLHFAEKNTKLKLYIIFLLASTISFIAYILNHHRIHKNRNILFLIPFSAVYFIFNFAQLGQTYFIWPWWPGFQDKFLSNSSIALAISMILFVQIFLHLKKYQPGINQILNIVLILNTGMFFLNNIQSSVLISRLVFLNGLLVYILTFIAVFRSRKFNFRITDILLLYTLLGLTIEYRIATMLFIIPFTTWFEWSMFIQLPLTLILFSRLLISNIVSIANSSREMETRYNELLERMHQTQKTEKSIRIKSIDTDDIIKKINQLVIEENELYDFDFDLAKMAALVGIRPDQLSQVLNSILKTSFSDFLNTVRIHNACELMRLHPEKNITFIMNESGYSSKSAFNHAFKKILNTTPSEFRSRLE